MKNNNKQAVKRLSSRSLKANRTRNAFALVAIVLTTFMISTVFSIGINFGKNMSVMTKRLYGTTASVFLTHPTQKQIDFIENLEGVENVGLQYFVGSVHGKSAYGKALAISLLALDEAEWSEHISPCIAEINGTYPQKENEVMLSAKALSQLSINEPQIGMEIPLECSVNANDVKETFVLSGWFNEYDATQTKGMAYLSQQFCKAAGLTTEKDGRVNLSVSKRNEESVYSAVLSEIGEKGKSNLTSTFSVENINGENTVVLILTIVMIALFIVFSGYLLTYNIMYISVTKDIRFYGMLKTLGTSPKQIKTIVFRQAMLLSCIGIPIGIILGVLTSFAIVPLAMDSLSSDSASFSAMPRDISFSPLIFVGSALFALFTIAVSCRKPAVIASRVSPVEAVKYTGVSEKVRSKDKKSVSGGKIYKMAFHNVFRDRKRAIVVFLSLFMGIVTFLCINSVFSSLDVNNYIDRYCKHDFNYQSSPPIGEVKFDSDFISEINKIDEIKDIETISADYVNMPFEEDVFKPVLQRSVETYPDLGTYDDLLFAMKNMSSQKGYGTWTISLSESYLKNFRDFDKDAFKRGETCIVGYGQYEDMIGKTLELTSEKTDITKKVKVAGCFNDSSECDFASFSYTVGTLAGVFVSEDLLEQLNGNSVITNIAIDVDKNAEPAVKSQLKRLNSELTNKTFIFTSRSDTAANFTSSMRTMNVLMGGISILLIFIGVINFVNVMTTGIFSRRRELAVLESIGMTKKQIYRMLAAEGAYYALITSLLIMSLGSAAMALVGKAMPVIADYAVFNYPIALVLIIIAVVFAVCLCVPPFVYNLSSKQSVIQRLHITDN